MDNAADEEKIEAKKDRKRSDVQTNETVIVALMSDRSGRRWLWNKMAEGSIFSSTICFGEDGFARTSFLEGKRSSALVLLTDCMRLNPKSFVLMMQENTKLETEDVRRNPDSRDPSDASDSRDAESGPGSASDPLDVDGS